MELFRLSLSCICLLPWLEVAEGQGFLIRNTRLEKCIHVSHHETNGIGLTDCKPRSLQQQWSWDPATRTITSLQTKQCLSAHRARDHALATLKPCGDWEHQAWACSKKGHLTLQSLGFHLSTKEGGHKVFVSREKDKFSRWKTLVDETICAAAQTAALRPGEAMREAVDTRVWIYETKTIDSSNTDAVDKGSSVDLSDPLLVNNFNSTVSPVKTKQAYLPANEDLSHNHSKKHHGNRGKTAGARLAGTNWKTAMLVLSPLAFILGLIILTLNVHYNKKKKILSALKNPAASSSRADLREPSPLRRGPQSYLPPSRSPSLRHGEILIEWKDGTVTPLFDNANYQVD
ncbi:uncharacterized protein [Anas acuta]|uniref:Uncharacterized LOC101789852 n=1 Tax=Anas platyrhynchos TaxID=8839 RepID=A0A8B9TXL7_ANAPL|nr:uncharacterized protein LOC101789852 isoform X1 [Anas platyrhynchos]|eukprot:XP_005020466.2 uncharacterized protein LOC101789852 isoform X1 [Anas platyrhynchos]